MSVFQQLRTWSPVTGDYVWRVSAPNQHGHELFMLIDGDRRGYRPRRAAALMAIQDALDAGCDPGEVIVSDPQWARYMEDAMEEERAA